MSMILSKGQIFKQAFFSTFSTKFWKVVGITSFVGLISLINLIWRIIEQGLDEILLYIGLSLATVVIIRYLFFCAKYTFVYLHNLYQESQWGNAAILLKQFHTDLKILETENYDEQNIKTKVVNMLNEYSKWLTVSLTTESSVSIKVPTDYQQDLNNWVLMNLFRDSSHSNTRDCQAYQQTRHTIIHNTPFSRVTAHITTINPKVISYVNEDIPNSDNYENTSIDIYGDKNKLPYKSEIVSPIMLYQFDQNSRCFGFLCVDCKDAKKFKYRTKYLCAMNEVLAEYLYPIMQIIQLNQNAPA